uniref:ethanolamine kinase n=1 Tax=Sus scrofa TaxID=9823 RepID=A0A8D1CJW0_PIG
MAVPPSAPLPCSPFYLRRQAPCPQCSWGMEEKAAAGAGCREPPGPPRAAAVPCFGISVDHNDILPGALRLIRELRPHWKPEQVRTKRFTDGITNKLVACYVDEDMRDCVLVRVYGERTELLVDRENEVRNFQLLRAHGCAPKLYCTFQNGLCYEYMQGMALGPEHIREPRLFRLIALEMAKIHTIHANGSLPKPILWHKIHNYFTLVKNEINPSLSADVPKVEVLEQELAWLKEHLSQLDSPVVFCHNDLLCKNIIYDSTKGHVRFIDYEYAGYNYQAFDIGNHFNEFAGERGVPLWPLSKIPSSGWRARSRGEEERGFCRWGVEAGHPVLQISQFRGRGTASVARAPGLMGEAGCTDTAPASLSGTLVQIGKTKLDGTR